MCRVYKSVAEMQHYRIAKAIRPRVFHLKPGLTGGKWRGTLIACFPQPHEPAKYCKQEIQSGKSKVVWLMVEEELLN